MRRIWSPGNKQMKQLSSLVLVCAASKPGIDKPHKSHEKVQCVVSVTVGLGRRLILDNRAGTPCQHYPTVRQFRLMAPESR